ncbi:hypothetical protein TetV_372 [Tetraselmis virus 1]|uniref:Uncharacterized protein n=1 Tax=Tetraselmis virus 1 TaxID=2060617 RepID=A0A2P0VNI3_9VIRU|nr:hypothetical protein QJ968_gp372 [Tetraselmis virus 1]AUF82464.1 hypothetical protein TetV_372 [Tetraselmis virus 1]
MVNTRKRVYNLEKYLLPAAEPQNAVLSVVDTDSPPFMPYRRDTVHVCMICGCNTGIDPYGEKNHNCTEISHNQYITTSLNNTNIVMYNAEGNIMAFAMTKNNLCVAINHPSIGVIYRSIFKNLKEEDLSLIVFKVPMKSMFVDDAKSILVDYPMIRIQSIKDRFPQCKVFMASYKPYSRRNTPAHMQDTLHIWKENDNIKFV